MEQRVEKKIIKEETDKGRKEKGNKKQQILQRTNCLLFFDKIRTGYKTKELGGNT
jgi:hypothetical protein